MDHADFEKLISEAIDILSKDDDSIKCIAILKRAAGFMQDNECSSRVYLQLLNSLLNGVNSKWYQKVCYEQPQLYDDFFFNFDDKEAVLRVLLKTVSETRLSSKLEKCLLLLDKFMSSKNFFDWIIEQCTPQLDSLKQDLRMESWIYLISSIISLPDKLAVIFNELPSFIRDQFNAAVYFQSISTAIIKALQVLHYRLENSIDVNLEFLRLLISRSCLAGHSEELLAILLQFLISETENGFIWRRLSQQLLVRVSEKYLENIVTFTLKTCENGQQVSNLFGDLGYSDERILMIISHKLLFIRTFEKVNVLNNLLEYLSLEKDQKILVKTFFRILETWGNKASFKHRSFHQHLYISKALIISLRVLNDSQKQVNKAAILTKMMKSMEAHLSSPMKLFHQIGVIVATLITKTVDPTGPQLQFQYEKDDLTLELESLLTFLPEKNAKISDGSKNEKQRELDDQQFKTQQKPKSQFEDIDSDDDLEPYDMSNDTVKNKFNKPRYLRDCIEGLSVVNDDYDRVQVCLESVEDLIRKESIGLNEVAVELTKCLLCLENVGALSNFSNLRFGALIALAVKCPKPVSTYLGEQFYMKNYNIKQRLDVLEVLSAAAQELSKPKQTEKIVNIIQPKAITAIGNENWQEVIQKRIDSKTRYFHKTHVKKEVIGEPNVFGTVAGCFFYPLMNSYDHRENPFDLLGADFFLLGRLIWYLGTILHASKNCPIIEQMGQTVLEFVASFRYHSEGYVRRAVIFAVCEVVATVPAHYLLSSLQERLIENGEWLKDIVEHDSDSECQDLAMKTLMLIDSTMKEQMKSELRVASNS